jgi:hypothetical protein
VSGVDKSGRAAIPVRGARRATSRSAGLPARLVRWRRRHLNLRTVVVVVVLSALLAPEVAAIIDAVP